MSRLAAILESNGHSVLQDIRPSDRPALPAGDASDLLDCRFVVFESKDLLQPEGVALVVDDILQRFDIGRLAEFDERILNVLVVKKVER